MRPVYERERDRQAEKAVIEVVYPGAVKLSSVYPVDFAVMRAGQVIGVAEVKVRSRQYADLLLSLRKAQALRSFAAWGLHARLVVAVPQGVYVYRVGKDRLPVVLGGRTDRGDSADIEPMVRIAWDSMRRACDAPMGLFDSLRETNAHIGAGRA